MRTLLTLLPWLLPVVLWLVARGLADPLLERVVPARGPRRRGPAIARGGGPACFAPASPRGGLLIGLGRPVRGPPLPA